METDISSSNPNPSETQRENPFESGGKRYASYRPSYPPALADALAGCLQNRRLALDVGCGSGQLTQLLSPLFDQVLGIDPSEDQLAQARLKAQHLSNLTFRQSPAEHTGVADGSVDLVVAAQAAHWFDLPAFYEESRRIASPRAAIALVTYGVPYINHWVNTIFQQGYWQRVHEFWPPERAQVESGYADLDFPFAAIDFPSFQESQAMTCDEFTGYITTWSAYKNAVARGCRDRFDDFFARLERAWPGSATCEVVWPIVVRAGHVRA
ncbi:MAG: class I SAM-dependent methyltransferase [Pseudomonadota bacterium]